jgi:hypothetical protein
MGETCTERIKKDHMQSGFRVLALGEVVYMSSCASAGSCVWVSSCVCVVSTVCAVSFGCVCFLFCNVLSLSAKMNNAQQIFIFKNWWIDWKPFKIFPYLSANKSVLGNLFEL